MVSCPAPYFYRWEGLHSSSVQGEGGLADARGHIGVAEHIMNHTIEQSAK